MENKNVLDYQEMYLSEKIKALQQELAYIQSRFGQAQAELQQSIKELQEYKNPPPIEVPIEKK